MARCRLQRQPVAALRLYLLLELQGARRGRVVPALRLLCPLQGRLRGLFCLWTPRGSVIPSHLLKGLFREPFSFLTR